LKPSFNSFRPKLLASARKARVAAKAAYRTRQNRHGDHHIGTHIEAR
jgi:hypothetical protein